LVGCGSSGDSPLIVATTWPAAERTQIEAVVRESSGDRRPIVWIALATGERLESVVDRRGGVDILLGGSASAYGRLAAAGRLVSSGPLETSSWKAVRRPEVDGRSSVKPPGGLGDPRVDPDSLALAKSTLRLEGWPKGYEGLVRAAARPRSTFGGSGEGSVPLIRSECLALVRGGQNQARAKEFINALSMRGFSPPLSGDELEKAAADDLLADLLGSALVDAHDELRKADAALTRFGHPAAAEAAIGQAPPWPPASVAKLLADSNGGPMVETLLEQVAPDPQARAWLAESWSRPKRPVDGALLAKLAGAADGRLALEPRFRAWLRAEWTAWTRQSYRRVARVAGGYVPS
jgi:hypothetical protein